MISDLLKLKFNMTRNSTHLCGFYKNKIGDEQKIIIKKIPLNLTKSFNTVKNILLLNLVKYY